MHRSPWTWFGVGLAAGLLGGVLLARRRDEGQHMPHFDAWQQQWIKTRGPVRAAMLAAQVQARYTDLYARQPHFTHRTLRRRLRKGILPGLALYQVLREEHTTHEVALAETETLFAAAYKGPSAFFPLLKRLPDSFAVFRAVLRWALRYGLPSEGWGLAITEDTPDCFAFEVRSHCLHRDVLATYGIPELTPIFCRMDDLLFSQLAPEIVYSRTKTLGRGDDCCDFRYCRGKPAALPTAPKAAVSYLDPIAETLLLPLCYRAMESQRPDALIRDPRAAEIVTQLDYDFVHLQRQPFQQLNVALRAREFDRAVRAFLAQCPDGIVVDIGCGLDTRFERVDNGRVVWFNLDFPEVIALREQFFAPNARCRTLATSALDLSWMDTVAQIDGRYLFLAEGVLPYLGEKEIRQLMVALGERFPGAEFMFDALPALMVRLGRLHPALRRTRAARVRWGLGDSHFAEPWGAGLHLLSDWRYYEQDEPRLGWYKWLRHVPFARDFRILRYRLGVKMPQQS
jgi:O-methyltransferase involved in polyketide biosynthesis